MKNLDIKHAAFHVIVGVYFIWLIVYVVLIGMALINIFTPHHPGLGSIFLIWLLTNLVMGTVLLMVIRLFKKSGVLNTAILYSYSLILLASVITVIILKAKG
jgi:hypothetical protein